MTNRRDFLKQLGLCAAATTASGTLFAAPEGKQTTGQKASRGGTEFDLQKFIDDGVAAGKQSIVVPPGRYRVTPHNREHLRLDGQHDIEILADGVEMVCTETTRALTVTSCRNVHVRGLTIDYDPLPFTEGHIVAMGEQKEWLDVELFDGYTDEGVVADKFEIFNPATNTLRTYTYYVTIAKQSPGHYRVSKPRNYHYDPQYNVEQTGDIVVMNAIHAPHGQIPHAVVCENCTDVTLESVTLYASNAFGFLESGCHGTHYLRCRIDRCAPADDIKERAYRRVRSLDADAFHSTGATKGPTIEGCAAHFQGDDCVNIHGDYHLITASQGKELRVLAKRDFNIQAGDPVELVAYDGRRLPDVKVTAVKPDGEINADERAFVAKQNMNPHFKALKIFLTKAYRIELDREVSLPIGSVVCAANRIGSNFAVTGNTFGFNRSRGILIKASHGSVSGNHLEGCWGEAVKVAPEWWWLEAGSSNDVQITNNMIRSCFSMAIAVYSFGGNGAIAPAGAHNDITIADNQITDCPLPEVLITSTTGLKMTNNALTAPSSQEIFPWYLNRYKLEKLEPVVKINCKETEE